MDKILQKLIIKFYFKYAVNKSAIPLSTSVKKYATFKYPHGCEKNQRENGVSIIWVSPN